MVPNTSTGEGISSSNYAKKTRDLIGLITDLRALGAQADFDLPRIAVIGNQSAGKSSLVEAVSGITVPRASGTCTRCPMECRMTSSTQSWKCQVLLRRETDAKGNKISAKEEPFGPLLTDKSQLEEMLRRAQLAILNPSVPSHYFVNFNTLTLKPGDKPLDSKKQLAFSNDVVCLDLSGPGLTDLSFIDLPGIISNVAKGEDVGNIDAVRNMVSEHIQGNTLILLTITMRDDIDNQGAANLAQLADEHGVRTIGVLTKPDTLQHGEEGGWLKVMRGLSHPLHHGYYITKQPSPKELESKITFDEARDREVRFFETTHPWSSQDDLRSRMGTQNLTQVLSRLLGSVISTALPALRQESKDSYQRVQKELNDLPPPPPENPAAELLRMVTAFTSDVNSIIQGAEAFESLIQKCRPVYAQFKTDIRYTAPEFKPFTSDEKNPKPFKADIDNEPHTANIEGIPRPKPMHLDQVRNHIQSSLTRQLPFNVPFSAKVSLIEQFFKSWDLHSQRCFSAVYDAARKELRALVEAHFGRFGGVTALFDHVNTIVESQIDRSRAKTLERIEWMLELENPPFTTNDHYFATYREKYLSKFKEARKTTSSIQPEGLANALSSLAAIGYSGLSEKDLARLLGADEYEEELIVMAESAAYFHVSYKRIIDNIPRIIDHDFLRSISKEIQDSLIKGLDLGTERSTERATMYLTEDEEVAEKRRKLKEKTVRLQGVLDRLYNFGM